MRSFSSKEGEIAAAILSLHPKKIEFPKSEKEKVPCMDSRFDLIDTFDISNKLSGWSY